MTEPHDEPLQPDSTPAPSLPPLPVGRVAFDERWIPAERMASRLTMIILGVVSAVSLLVLAWVGVLETRALIAFSVLWLILVPGLSWLGMRWPVWEYPYCGWRLTDESLDVWKGLLTRRQVRVPRSRVQYTDVKQGPIARRFGLGTLQVHVAGTEEATVAVPGLPHELALRLRDELIESSGDDAV